MTYVSIDIETTGLDPNKDQVLEIAAIVDCPALYSTPIHQLPRFHAKVYHSRVDGDPVALAMNVALLRGMEELAGEVKAEPWHIMNALYSFLNDWTTQGKIVAAGKNFGGFDRLFLNRFAPKAMKLVHHRVLDPGSMTATPEDLCPPSMSECVTRLTAKYPEINFPAPRPHEAMDDAEWVIRVIRSHWNRGIVV